MHLRCNDVNYLYATGGTQHLSWRGRRLLSQVLCPSLSHLEATQYDVDHYGALSVYDGSSALGKVYDGSSAFGVPVVYIMMKLS